MQNKIQLSIAALSLATIISSTSANACDCHKNTKETGLYLGLEGGLSAPVISTFKKKMDVAGQKVTAKGHLSNSPMYGALLGYKFYPGIAAEFSYQHKPKYKLNITLPDTAFTLKGLTGNYAALNGTQATAKKTSSKVKVTSDLYLLGAVYDLSEVKSFTPYVGVELGVANIKAKSQGFYSDIQTLGGTLANQEVMRIKKSSSIRPAAQFSLGFTKPHIIKNVNFYAAARVQLIIDAKLKYDLVSNGSVYDKGTLKQSLAIGEVVMGLTYDLPF